MSPAKLQVKVACLACRSYKTRCDGQQPCTNCSNNQRECHYRPSRRGGARRGERWQNAKRHHANTLNSPAAASFTSPEANDVLIGDLANLVDPFNSLHHGEHFGSTDIPENLRPSPISGGSHNSMQPFFIRSYQNEHDLLNAYYIFIHPYLPILPPSASPRYADNPQKTILTSLEPNSESLPFWPSTSPFALALMALLVLLPLQDDFDPMREVQIELRKIYSKFYARAALSSIESLDNGQDPATAAPKSTPSMEQVQHSSIHPRLPSILDPLLALLLLGIYEYCENSNRRQMRSRIYSALILAMDLSLHTVVCTNNENSEVQIRVWWMTMFLVYQSAIFNHCSPILLLDDARITTPFPDLGGHQELWPTLMKAQEILLKTGVVAREMTEDEIAGSHELMRQRVRELDALILSVISELDHTPVLKPSQTDSVALLNMWHMAQFLIHTARIKLHRFRAFGDYPVFLDKFCDLKSINSSLFSEFPLAVSPGRFSDSNSIFPFTEEESTQICHRAALALSRILKAISWPNCSYTDISANTAPLEAAGQLSAVSLFTSSHTQYPRSLPYMACCGMQGCYVLTMILRKIRTSLSTNDIASCRYLLSHSEPATERQDAERFIEELRHGVKLICDFMSANAVFGGVMYMAREVDTVYIAHFDD